MASFFVSTVLWDSPPFICSLPLPSSHLPDTTVTLSLPPPTERVSFCLLFLFLLPVYSLGSPKAVSWRFMFVCQSNHPADRTPLWLVISHLMPHISGQTAPWTHTHTHTLSYHSKWNTVVLYGLKTCKLDFLKIHFLYASIVCGVYPNSYSVSSAIGSSNPEQVVKKMNARMDYIQTGTTLLWNDDVLYAQLASILGSTLIT